MNQDINNEKLKETSCTDEEKNRKKAFQNIDTGNFFGLLKNCC